MQPTKGCKPFDMDNEVVAVGGILSLMPGIVPNPESPPFGTVGATELQNENHMDYSLYSMLYDTSHFTLFQKRAMLFYI